MYNTLTIARVVVLGLLVPGVHARALAQPASPPADPGAAGSLPASVPLLSVRLHAGPNLNLMNDWRSGLGALWDMTEARGLSPKDRSCICMSWGSTALVHVTRRVAIGGAFEMLRDTRQFTITDDIRVVGPPRAASFGVSNEAVVRTTQAVLAFYPVEGSHAHVQAGGGIGTGHTEMSTPGSNAAGRVHGTTASISAGTESRFVYVDAGWRLLRMRTTRMTLSDQDLGEARDVFGSLGELDDFVRGRKTDLSGGWVRAGLVFHFGRQ